MIFQKGGLKMISTGIKKLDEDLGGGIKEGSTMLLYAEPGVENLEFAYEILFTSLANGINCLYFVNNKRPRTVKEILRSSSWNTDAYEAKGTFNFIDGYSRLIGAGHEAGFCVGDPTDIKEIDKVLTNVIKKSKNSVIVFDNLSALFDLDVDYNVLLEHLENWIKLSRENKTTIIFLFTEWLYDKRITEEIKNAADCLVELKALEKNIILRKYFKVSKISWNRNFKSNDIPFKIVTPGGVRVYIPKILVTGPYHAGKTSFIHSASTRAVSVNRVGTTIALDFGHVDYAGFAVDLFGTPGQERFDPILEMLGSESFGVILVVDATNPRGFVRAKSMLEKTKTTGLPIVIAANKADMPGALKPEGIRSKMELTNDIPIVPVTAENLKAVKSGEPCKLKTKEVDNVLTTLFGMVI
jgi:small GTP-binding protein